MLIPQDTVSNLRRVFHVDPQEVWLKDNINGSAFFPEEESGSFNGLIPWQSFTVKGPPSGGTSKSSSLSYTRLLSLILVLRQLFSFLSELLQVSVAEMIDVQQYGLAIGCFVSFHASLSKSCEYVRAESKNVISVCRDSVHFAILLVLLTFLCKLLLLGGDIETNPGPPTRKCPQCSASIHIRKHSCDCGHILVKRGKKALEMRQCPSVPHW